MIQPIAVSVSEAARISGVGRSTLYAEMAEGQLKFKKIGRRRLITIDDLRAWLASKHQQVA
jgi:excisionase family DNA binding protein